jgi:phosphoglycerate dehydrogenase-like enzyme
MQAADFLAVGTHVQKVCQALGVKLFAADPNPESRGAQKVAEQVRLNASAVALCDR